MDISLYHPELGYYARAAQKTGRAGDFFTSVDVGPDLRRAAREAVRRNVAVLQSDPTALRPRSLSFDLVEAGAGIGRLARDILDAARANDPEFYSAIRLSLVEQSPAARAAQVETLGPHAALLAHSASALPEDVHGVIYANELLDALPTHAVVMTDAGLREVFIDSRRIGTGFVERFEELSTPRIAEYLARAGAEMRVGWRAEVNLRAEDWTKSAAESLRRGFIVLIDYGHDERELYSASHSAGTLTSLQAALATRRFSPGARRNRHHRARRSVGRHARGGTCRARRARAARSDLLHAGPRHHRSRRALASAAAGAEDAAAAWRDWAAHIRC